MNVCRTHSRVSSGFAEEHHLLDCFVGESSLGLFPYGPSPSSRIVNNSSHGFIRLFGNFVQTICSYIQPVALRLTRTPVWQRLPTRPTTTQAAATTEELVYGKRKLIGGWLLTCSGMVFAAVQLGGATR